MKKSGAGANDDETLTTISNEETVTGRSEKSKRNVQVKHQEMSQLNLSNQSASRSNKFDQQKLQNK